MIAGQVAQDLPFPHASVSLEGAFERKPPV